ncbi:MAG: alpha/beta hydrolase [Micrococcales bacterium]|nr:alpha/beta hydrolase [Micrococcales bacterium]
MTGFRDGRWTVVALLAGLLGFVWLAVPAWVALTRFDVLRAGHPAYPVALAVSVLIGAVLLVLVARTRLRGASQGRHPARRWLGVAAVLAGVLATALVPGGLAWLRPFAASPIAVEAMRGTGAVEVTQDSSSITLTPIARTPMAPPAASAAGSATAGARTGLIFQPGARVDPRAYVPLLAEVAARGHPIVIVKQPFDLAFTALAAPFGVMDARPQVHRWVVAGHSLGAVAAARAAAPAATPRDPRIVGLALWAGYPDDSTTVRDLPVLSVYGTADGLATPAKVDASRRLLPSDTAFVAVDGGVHAYFGDYGEQPGDGTPTIDRTSAQRIIADATASFLGRN